MKISFKILPIAILLMLGNRAMAQFTNVRYNYDANGNRWQRLIEFSLNKTSPLDTTGYTKSVTNPFKPEFD